MLVEGPDDVLVMRPHIAPEIVFAAGTRSNVIRAVSALQEWGMPGVRAIIDADYDPRPANEAIFSYDARDLEGMLVRMGVLDLIIDHLGSAEKIKKLNGASTLVAKLIQLGEEVGALRASNRENGWGLPFRNVDPASKTDIRTLVFDRDRYIRALIQASETEVTFGEINDALSTLAKDELGPNGKDVLSFAAVALRNAAGTLHKEACSSAVLGAQLRSSCALELERSEWMTMIRTAVDEASNEITHPRSMAE
ncbi:hypothetical protein GCM10027427_28610 [Pseudoclavibacter terrae]